MRWFYVPNENKEGDQVGPRMAFEKMHADGVFSAYQAYSYLVRRKELNSQQDALDDFYEAALAFKPDVIFAQHINFKYPLDRAFLKKLKAIPSRPKLIIHEGDPYHRWIKKLDAMHHASFSEADLVILVGLGTLANLAREAGAKNIRLITHSYDSQRFGDAWEPTLTRKYDAVMIANCSYFKRIPGFYLPGGKKRKQLGEVMFNVLGDRFAVFGGGQAWQGRPYAKGNLPFDEQGKVIRDSWMSVNWHHFDEIAMYSSDRLPISLACGVPHITNYQVGYEHLFEGIPGLFVVKTPEEAGDVALYILSMNADKRNELGLAAAEYAKSHFEAINVYTNTVSMIKELFSRP